MDKDFIFNGKSTEDFSVISCNLSNGNEQTFAATGKTELTTSPLFDGSVFRIISNKYSESLKFEIGLIPKTASEFTPIQMSEIIKWLCNPTDYCLFQVIDPTYSGINYFVKFSEPTHFHINGFNGLKFTATTQHPFGLSDEFMRQFSTTNNSSFTLINYSDETENYLYPNLIEIKAKTDIQTLTITSTSNRGKTESILYNLKANEVVTMDSANRILSSTDSSKNILSNFNKNWVRLAYGKNTFTINENVDIKFVYREVRKVGIV